MELNRGRLAGRYIFIELLPGFIIGVFAFVFILLLFQALRLTEFVLVHGVDLRTIGQMLVYMSVSFLPIILPMSLLFAVLLGYGRLSADSEIVALRALGLSMIHITAPAVVLSVLTAIASAYVSFQVAPWGNRQFEVLVSDIGRLKASVTLREGVFSEGFFDMVVYANQIDNKAGLLNKVFIFDERDRQSPMTIIAQRGSVVRDKDPRVGERARLRLEDGSIHRRQKESYTRIDFTTYDLSLFNPSEGGEAKKSLPSLTLRELSDRLKDDLAPSERVSHLVEWHRRWSLSAACILFALIGVGLGTTANRRNSRSGGMVLCLTIIVGYWLLYVGSEGLARSQWLAPGVALWMVNGLTLAFALWSLRRAAT